MTARRTWRLVRIVTLGLVLTAAVAVLDRAGSLLTLEQWTYDMRVRHFQRHFAKPDDGIVHVMIDDVSMEPDKIGGWPWPRSRLAALLNEAVRDGARHVAFDVSMEDDSRPETRPELLTIGKPSTAAAPANNPAEVPASVRPNLPPDPDDQLASAMRSATAAGRRILLPVSIDDFARPPDDEVMRRTVELLEHRLDLTPVDVADRLGVAVSLMRSRYYDLGLHDAMARVARAAVRQDGLTDDTAIIRALPKTLQNRVWIETVESKALRRALQLARTVAAIESKATQPVPEGGHLLDSHIVAAPLNDFAAACTDSGFVDYPRPADGRVRVMPLVVAADGRLVPHFALALAALRLDIDLTDPDQFEVSPGCVVLRPPGRPEIRVPIRVADAGNPPRPVGALFDIPLRGGSDFMSMYAPREDAFVSAYELWRAVDVERRIRVNLGYIVNAVDKGMSIFDPNDPAADDAPSIDNPDAVIAAGVRLLAAATAKPNTDPSEGGRALRNSMKQAEQALKNLPVLREMTTSFRQQLRQKLNGKTVIFGWASTSQVADTVSTSLHAACPGFVIHGAIANAILSGELWTHLSPDYATALTGLCGVLTTLAVTFLTPSRALVGSGGLLLLVTGGASAVLFDRYNIVIGLAGPMTAVVVCWAACTLVVTLRERLDRAQVTKRFRSYVDPALVSYVIDHPETDTLAGESREMTVVFIDVEGFTALTERMGEKSIAILRQLMDALVPIIRRHNGFVNKFLGDGVMFFYGAPRRDPDHARHAVRTVLQMQQALKTFNDKQPDGVPKLGVRAGISTGQMLVGDAGSADASDYTVLGDAVNLASRLEGANKPLGTAALATARTAELCGDEFLFAPLGRLIVVGKEHAVAVCEPVCDLARADADQKACAEMLSTIWSHIDARSVRDAMAETDKLRTAGRTKLCDLLHTVLRDLPTLPADQAASIRLSGK